MAALDTALLDAHAADDKAALVTLYAQAADEAAEEDAMCFFLTHAFVFALELGDDRAADFNRRLAELGRAELLNWP